MKSLKRLLLGLALLFTTSAMAQVSTDTTDNTIPQQLQLVALASHLVRYGYAGRANTRIWERFQQLCAHHQLKKSPPCDRFPSVAAL